MLLRELNRGLLGKNCSPWGEVGCGWEILPGVSSLTSSLLFQLVKQCVGTVTWYWIRGDFDITCNDVSGPFCTVRTARGVGCGISFGPMTRCPIQGRERFSYPGPSLPRAPGLQSWLCVP